jgi:hypothetical protein
MFVLIEMCFQPEHARTWNLRRAVSDMPKQSSLCLMRVSLIRVVLSVSWSFTVHSLRYSKHHETLGDLFFPAESDHSTPSVSITVADLSVEDTRRSSSLHRRC